MADLPVDDSASVLEDSASVLEEGRHGYAAGIDTSGDFMHLPKEERAAAKARSRKRHEKLRRAQAIRATWSESDFEAERQRLQQEVEAILAAREEEKRDAA